MRRNLILHVTLMAALGIAGCSAPKARIRGADEESLVDDSRAGAVVYRNVIDQALKSLSDKYRASTAGKESFVRIKVAFMGIDNNTSEELGTWRQQINDIVNRAINESGDFTDISFERFIKPALKSAGVRKESLALPAERRKLMAVLEQSGNPVDAFLFASLTQGNSRSGSLQQADYLLTLELMNSLDGTRIMAHGELSKEYSR